jgi:hypothetical protein
VAHERPDSKPPASPPDRDSRPLHAGLPTNAVGAANRELPTTCGVGYRRRMGAKKSAAKMVPTKVSVQTFVKGLADERRRREAKALISMMKEVTGEKPVMWGPTIVGFGSYHYKYASGREGDAPRAAFSPRGAALTVYCMPGFTAQLPLLRRLGPHTTSVSCLYIRHLDDVDADVLRAIVARTFEETNRRYPA